MPTQESWTSLEAREAYFDVEEADRLRLFEGVFKTVCSSSTLTVRCQLKILNMNDDVNFAKRTISENVNVAATERGMLDYVRLGHLK